MGFSRVSIRRGSLTYKGRPSNFGAYPAGQQVDEKSGDPSWIVKPDASVAGSTNIIHTKTDTGWPGSRNYRPGTGETKGSTSYTAVIQPTESPISFSEYKPYVTTKPAFGKPKEAKPVVRPNTPVSSAKQPSIPVGGSASSTRYWPVIGQSTGSTSYKPVNWPSKASVDSGLHRPSTVKPARGKDEVKQVLVRPNLHAKPSSAVKGSTSSLSHKPARPNGQFTGSANYRPVAGATKGSTSYRPSNELPMASVNFGPYKPYTANPALGKDQRAKQKPVGPQSSVVSANPSYGSFGSFPSQWATPEASSLPHKQRGQVTPKKSHSHSQASHGYGYATEGGRQNPANSPGVLPVQEEGFILIVIPSHLGTGVLETVSRRDRDKQRNELGEPATSTQGANPSKSWQWLT